MIGADLLTSVPLVVVAAVGVTMLARRLGAPAGAAPWAAAAFVLHGGFAGTADPAARAVVAFLPWILLLADRAVISPAMTGLPAAVGVAVGLLVVLRSGYAAVAYHATLACAVYVLTRRPRQSAGLRLACAALGAITLIMVLTPRTPVEGAAVDPEQVARGLFPYLAPGRLAEPSPSFVGIVVYSLALLALVGLPLRVTGGLASAALAALALLIRSTRAPGLPPPPAALFGLMTILLAALGLGILDRGLPARPRLGQRNMLALLTAALGGLCFHVTGLYLLGGGRPGDGPTPLTGAVLASATFAAALCPMLAILTGAWTDRRRGLAMAVAAVSLAELLAVLLR